MVPGYVLCGARQIQTPDSCKEEETTAICNARKKRQLASATRGSATALCCVVCAYSLANSPTRRDGFMETTVSSAQPGSIVCVICAQGSLPIDNQENFCAMSLPRREPVSRVRIGAVVVVAAGCSQLQPRLPLPSPISQLRCSQRRTSSHQMAMQDKSVYKTNWCVCSDARDLARLQPT